MDTKIHSFTDLKVWKEGHALVLLVYKITKDFPKYEMYSLIDQMRRATSSVTANIAEGFGRRSYKEKIQFYYLAQGSLTELKDQILIAKDIGYLKPEEFQKLVQAANDTHQLLQGLIQSSLRYIQSTRNS